MWPVSEMTMLIFILRVILGILFFFQGADKIFKVKLHNVIETFKVEMANTIIPVSLIGVSAYITSFIELICGGLLILGLFKTTAYYLLGFDLILVTVAFSMIRPMWDMQFILPRLLLLAALMYLPQVMDTLSLDYLFHF